MRRGTTLRGYERVTKLDDIATYAMAISAALAKEAAIEPNTPGCAYVPTLGVNGKNTEQWLGGPTHPGYAMN